jgi:hypothetical protein
MMTDYREKLAEVGFVPIEIEAVALILMRMGVLPLCEHTRPRFIECYEFESGGQINEARWQKGMRESGFRSDAIALAEHALFGEEMGRC